jgi:hypothetical protein
MQQHGGYSEGQGKARVKRVGSDRIERPADQALDKR